jgi:uncharacterized protein YcaQ
VTDPLRFSPDAARQLVVAAQGLDRRPRRKARKADVLAMIRRMGVLQIDTIHVVARSPYLVLYSRLGSYAPRWLDELLEEGRIFECWAHEACFAPFVDHDLHRFHADEGGRKHWSLRSAARTRDAHAKAVTALLEHIRAGGPVKAGGAGRTKSVGSRHCSPTATS